MIDLLTVVCGIVLIAHIVVNTRAYASLKGHLEADRRAVRIVNDVMAVPGNGKMSNEEFRRPL